MKKIYAIINSAKFKTFNKTKPMTKKVAHRRLDIRLAHTAHTVPDKETEKKVGKA